jgi:hypothetical protein
VVADGIKPRYRYFYQNQQVIALQGVARKTLDDFDANFRAFVFFVSSCRISFHFLGGILRHLLSSGSGLDSAAGHAMLSPR